MIGPLGSTYDVRKPFFEVLINSMNINGNEFCSPFFVTIHANGEELEKRRQALASYKMAPSIIAHPVFLLR